MMSTTIHEVAGSCPLCDDTAYYSSEDSSYEYFCSSCGHEWDGDDGHWKFQLWLDRGGDND